MELIATLLRDYIIERLPPDTWCCKVNNYNLPGWTNPQYNFHIDAVGMYPSVSIRCMVDDFIVVIISFLGVHTFHPADPAMMDFIDNLIKEFPCHQDTGSSLLATYMGI